MAVPRTPAAKVTSTSTDAALISAVRAAETPLVAAKAPASVVIAAGITAARAARPSLNPSGARSIASAEYQAILGSSDTSTWGQIVHHPGASFGAGVGQLNPIPSWLKGVVPYLKITAGGLVMGVSGLALVYVAGRNTAPAQAAKQAAAFLPGGRVVTAAGARIAPNRSAERSAVKVQKRALRSSEARERARSRVESGGGRVRVVSKKAGARNRDTEAAARYARSRESSRGKGAPSIEGVGSRRRRAA